MTNPNAFFSFSGVVGVTGHRSNRFSAEHERELARICTALFAGAHKDCSLMSCMASGTDTIAAEAWPLDRKLRALLPVPISRWRTIVGPEIGMTCIDRLLCRAETDVLSDAQDPDYDSLSSALVDRVDRVFAVWDGATGKPGGTGTVVHRARSLGRPVLHLLFDDDGFSWPDAAMPISV